MIDVEFRRDVDRALLERRRRQSLIMPSVAHQFMPGVDAAVATFGWWAAQYLAPSGGYVEAWIARLDRVVHRALRVYVPVLTYTSTCNVRLRATGAGGIDLTTNVVAFGTGVYAPTLFEWLHGMPLWSTEDVKLAVEVDVLTASVPNPVLIYIPYGGAAFQRYPVNATTTGL